MNALNVLRERGFVKQCSDEDALEKLLGTERVTFYAGFDPTADSLHAGSLLPIMAMAHLQRAGHFPIAIFGGGTAMIGDPSGKTELRKLLSREDIARNGAGIRAQLSRYLDFGDGQGLLLDNSEWLLSLNYIEFLRDIGRHFKVNEMLRAEGYRLRLEREEGLSFIEFNYQLLQAYDFLVMHRQHGCKLQLGGDDQWGNILAGTDLIRKLDGADAHALTLPLLTTARGEKMGKTAGGAVWLSAEKLSPYEFYQYWINVDDRDVGRFLALFTFLPMDEVNRLGAMQGADLRRGKEALAFEATTLCHGAAEAEKARDSSRAAFGGSGSDLSSVPTTTLPLARFEAGIPIIDLLCETGLAASRGEAKRLLQQGGVSVNEAVVNGDRIVNTNDLQSEGVMLRTGKKKHHRVILGNHHS